MLDFPVSFYIACIALVFFGVRFWHCRYRAWGLPALAVLATASIWYVGDAIYNDYAAYREQFGDNILDAAWWQVVLFVVAFGTIVGTVNDRMNHRLLHLHSQVIDLAEGHLIHTDSIQRQLERAAYSLAGIWILLSLVALYRTQFDWIGVFFPWAGHRAAPWGRGRLGGGMDALLSLAAYLQIFLTASFGVLAALLKNTKARGIAITIFLLSAPYFVFDRTRNAMLATVMPGFLSWVFLRLQGGIMFKFGVLCVALFVVDGWMRFVMDARSSSAAVASAFAESGDTSGRSRHLGLSMFSELLFIEAFVRDGSYTPNLGARYFAEIVNPIPRAIWSGKPTVGIDYAIVRGFGKGDLTASDAGVTASISTGFIGQGVVNFGSFFGPIAAAVLMALWVGVLARQDLLGAQSARLLLYASGMILTFNMGRDITFLVAYPFIFGWIIVLAFERRGRNSNAMGNMQAEPAR